MRSLRVVTRASAWLFTGLLLVGVLITGLAAGPSVAPAAASIGRPGGLPGDGSLHWKVTGKPAVRSPRRRVRLNECASVTRARRWRQQAYTGAGQLPGERDVFTFATPRAARAGYAAVLRGMAACQATTRKLQARAHVRVDAVVTRAARAGFGAAWTRRWTGVAGLSAPGAQVNHLYVAQRGNRVTDFMFTRMTAPPGRQPMAGQQTTPTRARTAGGPITRAQILQRAKSWVSEHVPYDESAYWTDADGVYREDCSGYVSMAWDLTSSLVTQTLPQVSSLIANKLNLKPGDILDYAAEHTFIFAGWTDRSGDFDYYAESNPSDPTHGPTAASIYDATLEGWPNSDYSAYQYDNLVTSTVPAPPGNPAVVAQPDGDLSVAWAAPGGSVWAVSHWVTGDGPWLTATEVAPAGSAVSAPALAAQPNGTLTAAWPGKNGTLQTTATTGTTWPKPTTVAGAKTVASTPALATQPNGTLNLTYRTSNGAIYWTHHPSHGTWTTPTQLAPPGSAVSAPALAAQPNGTLTTAWQSKNGLLEYAHQTAASAWSKPAVVASDVAGAPGLAAQPNGNLNLVWEDTSGVIHLEYWTPVEAGPAGLRPGVIVQR